MLEDSNFGLYISDAFHKAFLEVSQILSTSLRACFTLYKSFFPSVGRDHWLYSNDQRSFQVWEAKPMQKYKKKLFSWLFQSWDGKKHDKLVGDGYIHFYILWSGLRGEGCFCNERPHLSGSVSILNVFFILFFLTICLEFPDLFWKKCFCLKCYFGPFFVYHFVWY